MSNLVLIWVKIMSAKNFFKPLVPPVFVDLFRKNQITDTFKSFESALASVRYGYENIELATVVVQKNIQLKEQIEANRQIKFGDLRVIAAIGMTNRKKVRVLDFGGGGGAHYFIAKAVLGNVIELDWSIVETEATVQQARVLETNHLKFFSSIEEAANHLKEVDLVYSSSALQYTPDPLITVKQLIALNAPKLFITRTPFTEGAEKIISKQVSLMSANGPGALPKNIKDKRIEYPITFVSKEKLRQILTNTYEIQFEIEEECNVFRIKNEPINYWGFFCNKNEHLRKIEREVGC